MHAKISRILLIAVVVFLSAIDAPTAQPSSAATPSAGPGYGSLLFVENVGQFDERARFQVRGGPGTLWLAEDALWLTLAEHTAVQPRQRATSLHADLQPANLKLASVKLSFVDANPHPRIEPFNRLDSMVHYYRGSDPSQWHTNAPVWGGVRYVDLYPGLNLEITGEGGRLAWRLVCRADCASTLQQTRLRVEGSEAVTVQDGCLNLTTAVGDLALPLLTVEDGAPESQPMVAQLDDDAFEVVVPLSVSSHPWPPHLLLAPQDNPGGLLASMFIGGDDLDGARAITVDGEGAVYVTGFSGSTDTYWPQSPGVYDVADIAPHGAHTGPIFVAKFSADLGARSYMTFVGDEFQDNSTGITERGNGIVVDDVGNVYVTGQTMSLDEFPVTDGAFDADLNDGVDENCPTGRTDRPCPDAFVVKLNASGWLEYATYLGGSYIYAPGNTENWGGNDYGVAIGVDKHHHVYVFGETNSQDFPTTPGAFDREFSYVDIGLNPDIFVVKLDPAGNGSADLLYGTYLGSGFVNSAGDMVVDEDGIVYATGHVEGRGDFVVEPKIDFPTTPGAYPRSSQCLARTCSDLFFFKLNPAGQGEDDLLYGTFFGGTAPGSEFYEIEGGSGIALDQSGAVYIVGKTETQDYPTTSGAYMEHYPGGGTAALVSKLNPAGNGADDMVYSTYLGGVSYDEGASVAVDKNGHVYVTGETYSNNFPVTRDAYDSTHNGKADVFVTRLNPAESGAGALAHSTYFGGFDTESGAELALAETGTVYVTGSTNSWFDFPITPDAYDTSFGGYYDGFVSKLTTSPPFPDLSSSQKTVAPDTAAAGQVVTFTVQLVNSGVLSATVAVTDTLPAALIPRGAPSASSGPSPVVAGQTLTWVGSVLTETTVTLTYAAELTSTSALTPTAVNEAQIDDGVGNVYTRRAFVNGHSVFLPLVLR